MPARKSEGKRRSSSPFQLITQQLKWIDLIFEVRDGRAPISSAHPRADKLFGNKPRVIILSKDDLADPTLTKHWLADLSKGQDRTAIALDLKLSRGKDRLVSIALDLTAAVRQKHTAKGLLPRPIRACVIGIPNVGKSSFINWLIGRRKTRVGDRPGVTKGPQWVRIHPQIELLDTPGILPPTGFAEETAQKLALLNLLPESAYDVEAIGQAGLEVVAATVPAALDRYLTTAGERPTTLEQLAHARKCLTTGGRADTMRSARLLLGDFRCGALGRLTLDSPATIVSFERPPK